MHLENGLLRCHRRRLFATLCIQHFFLECVLRRMKAREYGTLMIFHVAFPAFREFLSRASMEARMGLSTSVRVQRRMWVLIRLSLLSREIRYELLINCFVLISMLVYCKCFKFAVLDYGSEVDQTERFIALK